MTKSWKFPRILFGSGMPIGRNFIFDFDSSFAASQAERLSTSRRVDLHAVLAMTVIAPHSYPEQYVDESATLDTKESEDMVMDKDRIKGSAEQLKEP